MGSYTKSDEPLVVVQGRAISWPLTWQDNVGAAINLTGFQFDARLEWRDYNSVATVDVVSAAAGTFKVSLTDVQASAVPEGTLATLTITITDTLQQPNDFVIPLTGVVL